MTAVLQSFQARQASAAWGLDADNVQSQHYRQRQSTHGPKVAKTKHHTENIIPHQAPEDST